MSVGSSNFKFAGTFSFLSLGWVWQLRTGTLTFGKMSVILDVDSHSLVSGKELWMSQLAATREWQGISSKLWCPAGKHRSLTHPTIHPKSISLLGFLQDCRCCCQFFLVAAWSGNIQAWDWRGRDRLARLLDADQRTASQFWYMRSFQLGEDGTITALRKDSTWSNWPFSSLLVKIMGRWSCKSYSHIKTWLSDLSGLGNILAFFVSNLQDLQVSCHESTAPAAQSFSINGRCALASASK